MGWRWCRKDDTHRSSGFEYCCFWSVVCKIWRQGCDPGKTRQAKCWYFALRSTLKHRISSTIKYNGAHKMEILPTMTFLFNVFCQSNTIHAYDVSLKIVQ